MPGNEICKYCMQEGHMYGKSQKHMHPFSYSGYSCRFASLAEGSSSLQLGKVSSSGKEFQFL